MCRKIALLICQLAVLAPAFAGTVITNNLPANYAIINIDGQQDGSRSFNGDQSLWYQPFNMSGGLLEYTVSAGTYSFRVINAADAAQQFPALTPAQTNQMFSAWTYNSPYIEDYLVFDSSAAANSNIPQLFDGAPDPTSFGDAASAYNHAVTNGWNNLIRTGPQGRDGTSFIDFYKVSATTTFIFAVPDYDLSDNHGGVSVLISPVSHVTPLLSILPSGTNVTLQWTTNALGYTLAQTINLPPAAWADVPTVPGITNGKYSVTLPKNGTNQFFHLHH